MTVRPATAADLPALERLWRAFVEEMPPPEYGGVDFERELAEIAALVRDGVALLAEEEGSPVGFALAHAVGPRTGELTDLYVLPGSRRAGVAGLLVRELVGQLADQGIEHVELDVSASNSLARTVYARWGLREERTVLGAPTAALLARLEPAAPRAELGVVYVQTDDHRAVERAATAFAPRIGSPGVEVDPPVNGWIAVRDAVAGQDPAALKRVARELSDRLGAVVLSIGIETGAVVRVVALERGSVVDEYLSVPEFHGPLQPGDVIALAANATVLHRLTGADPARLRSVARTALTPADLPPPLEHAAAIAAALGLPSPDR